MTTSPQDPERTGAKRGKTCFVRACGVAVRPARWRGGTCMTQHPTTGFRLPLQSCRLHALLASSILVAACDLGEEPQSCTLGSCQSVASVAFLDGPLASAYELEVTVGDATYTLLCAPPAADLDATPTLRIECDQDGFRLHGSESEVPTVFVVIRDPMSEEPMIESEVALEHTDTWAANGPDCPPICEIREGAISLNVQPAVE